jgi:hypothetical protein
MKQIGSIVLQQFIYLVHPLPPSIFCFIVLKFDNQPKFMTDKYRNWKINGN